MNREVLETKQFFEKQEIYLSDHWLQGCINWFHEQNEGAPYSKKDLHVKVYEQWLQLDLRQVEIPQIPINVQSKPKIVINKTMILQMMSVIDISKPKFAEIQKLKNLNMLTRGFEEEKEVGSTSKRMLQLTLTDGLQDIKAIEYKSIPSLNIKLLPGMKIKIKHPVTVRRGQMLLEQHNVVLLGGDVDDILVSHATENILASHLNLPINPNPNNIDEIQLSSGVQDRNISSNNRNETNTVRNKLNSQNTRESLITNYASTNRNQVSARSSNDVSEEEELRIAAEVEMLLQVEQGILGNNIENNQVKRLEVEIDVLHKVNTKEKDILQMEAEIDMLLETENDIMRENQIRGNTLTVNKQSEKDVLHKVNTKETDILQMEAEIDMLLEVENDILRENQIRENAVTVNKQASQRMNESDNKSASSSSLDIETDIFNSSEMDEHLNMIEEKYHTSPRTTIKDVLENIHNKKYGKYNIKAKFKSVLQKLTVKDDQWFVKICVTDDLHELAVCIDSDVVSEMTGVTPKQAMDLKKCIERDAVGAKRTIMKALNQFVDKLRELDCTIEVKLTENSASPTITKVL